MDNSYFIRKKLSGLCKRRYDGLKLVSEVRKALRQGMEDEQIVSFIVTEFGQQVETCFREEDEWVLPNLTNDDALRVFAEKQHEALVKKVAVNASVNRPPFFSPEEFADMLEENIRFELRTLFPVIQKVISRQKNENRQPMPLNRPAH